MDYAVDLKFQNLVRHLEKEFGPGLDTHTILFIIGVQELGLGYKKFKKAEKTDLMHVALCTILEPYGYYKYIGNDKDNWPHFELQKELPHLEQKEQQFLMKEAILDYFVKNGYVEEDNVKSSEII